MGKKVKVGKARKDKFYFLAKETGYRSRASFKLLQLNRRYDFFASARVCIDLCAAPGSWMQVAVQNMPVSSIIVGVDLFPIAPIPGTNSIVGDITDGKTSGMIKRYTQTWKADVVLNDGAPNMGKNWLYDAYQQAVITLAALKLAAQFLRRGGTFVTKVFRSRDYHSLMWVFNQLFKKTHATKPKASRLESTEIFVVCKGFLAPDKIDPQFFDPKQVFKEVVVPSNLSIEKQLDANLKKQKAEGYDENLISSLRVVLNVSNFFYSSNAVELLSTCHKIAFDDKEIENHTLTTTEIKALCDDIKVLSSRDLRKLLNWRKKFLRRKEDQKEADKKEAKEEEKKRLEEGDEEDEEALDKELEDLDEHIAKVQEEEAKILRKKKKKVLETKRKLRDRMRLKMVIPEGETMVDTESQTFTLKKLKSQAAMKNFQEGNVVLPTPADPFNIPQLPTHVPRIPKDNPNFTDEIESESDEGGEGEEQQPAKKRKVTNGTSADPPGVVNFDSDDESDMSYMSDKDFTDSEGESLDEVEPEDNPLLVNLDENRIENQSEMWFNRDGFKDLTFDGDEDIEVAQMAVDYMKKGGQVTNSTIETERQKLSGDSTTTLSKEKRMKREARKEQKQKRKEKLKKFYNSDSEAESEGVDEEDFEEVDSDSDGYSDEERMDYYMSEKDINKPANPYSKRSKLKKARDAKAALRGKETFYDKMEKPSRVERLTPEELALAEKLVFTEKSRRDLIESSYNRYAQGGGDDMPSWFEDDEKKHMTRPPVVPQKRVQFYNDRQKEANARPIKKIAEAKARKKMRVMKRLEKARKKTQLIEGEDMTEQERWRDMKTVYKKAGLLGQKRKQVTYVVAKKGVVGARARRPKGVKGPFKLVDSKMKADGRVKRRKEKKQRFKVKRRGPNKNLRG